MLNTNLFNLLKIVNNNRAFSSSYSVMVNQPELQNEKNLTQTASIEKVKSGAVRVFSDLHNQRIEISNFLNGKSGVYCLINKTNGKFYVGSAMELRLRVNRYFQNGWLSSHSYMVIVKAILKNKIDNFELVILELCDIDEIRNLETSFISSLNPYYNILETGGDSSGYRHTVETIAEMKKKTVSAETRLKMSEARQNLINNGQAIRVSPVSVLDLTTNVTTDYISIAQAARDLKLSLNSLYTRFQRGTKRPLNNRYVITLKNTNPSAPVVRQDDSPS
jgi:hypothetical protein